MKAIVHDEYGSPDNLRLRDIDEPVAGPGEVLVRVRAASVNPPDWAGLHGVPYVVRLSFGLRRPKQPIRGTDLAGEVVAAGAGASRFRVGDAVFGRGDGTFAELAVAREEELALKPAAVTWEQAAAVPMSGLVALQGLRDVGKLQPGQDVLITGAGGGIGTFAVQIAKSMGAVVTGVCSTSKVDLVRSLGADEVIDYTQRDFTTERERYDLILDNVLAHPLSRLVKALRRGGALIPNGGQFYKRWTASAGVILIKAPLLSLVVPQRIPHITTKYRPEDLATLAGLVESGAVTPVIGETYPLSRAAEALAVWGSEHARGKQVIVL